MVGIAGRRTWGNIKEQRTQIPSYQASYLGPDQKRYYAPKVFGTRVMAEAWLEKEKDYVESCVVSGDTWKPPHQRSTVENPGVYVAKARAERKSTPNRITPVEYVLYRFFDDHHRLLYVGMTSGPNKRFQDHARAALWWSEVYVITLRRYKSHAELARAESMTIRREKPIHNVADRQGPPQQGKFGI